MTVEIRFEPDGPSGLVAEGTYLWDAARRLGFQIPAECEGRGECDTCAVAVLSGATLLSAPTAPERKQLKPNRLEGGERLACQCKVERSGELRLRLALQTERATTADEMARDLLKEFGALPLNRKIATLMKLETIAMSDILGKIADTPFSLAEKLLDLMARKGRKLNRQKREAAHPPEHTQKR